jgi:hypothetical protein
MTNCMQWPIPLGPRLRVTDAITDDGGVKVTWQPHAFYGRTLLRLYATADRRSPPTSRLARLAITSLGQISLAGKEGHAHLPRSAQVRGQVLQPRDATGDMEAPDADRKAGGEERLGEINGPEKLVRLDAD